VRQVSTVAQYRRIRQEEIGTARLGFVPTMGALHKGHESLIEKSVGECDITIVSIYVNPTQFDNPDDLNKYPETLDEDLRIAEALGVDYVLLPRYEALYPDAYRYKVVETEFSKTLCGAWRDGHFTGVLTVVMKLLNLVRPDRAYFGEKDFQQYKLIRDMASAFLMDVEIVSCPIVREEDGLAMSSRNLNLDEASRRKAPLIHRLIASRKSDGEIARELMAAGFEVDYVTTLEGRRFAAARLGKGAAQVRLIDNVPLE